MSLALRVAPPLRPFGRRADRVVERNLMVYRRTWIVLASGFVEPVFYLFSLGFGMGAMVGMVPGPSGPIPYAAFVAPALLASAAMNGAIYDSTFNVFHKLKWAKTYDAMLTTPLGVGDVAVGEIAWAVMRGTLYAVGFMVVMVVFGLVGSPWGILIVPAAMLVAWAFAAVGMAATTFMRTWQDFDLVPIAIMPLFLFSGTFYPIEAYPPLLQAIVRLTPLYQGVDLIRGLSLGAVGPASLFHVAYLTVMGLVGVAIASRRLRRLLTT